MRMLICAGIGLLLVCGASMAPADLVETLDAHYAAVNALDVTPDGSTLFSAGKDGRLKLWDVATYELLMDVPACQVAINDIAVDPDGTFVVTAGDDGFVKVWDALTADLLVAIPAHEGPVNCVAVEPDNMMIYSGGDDGYFRAWSVEEEYALDFEVFAHYYGVNDIILNDVGDYAFTGGVDGFICVFNSLTGELESRIEAYENAEVLCLQLTHDPESCLFTGGTNGEVRIWDAATGSLVNTIRAHAGNVKRIVFLEDDSLALTAGEDGKLKLWNRDADKAGEMQAHVLAVHDFLMTGDTLITGGADYKVRIWDAHF